MPLELSVLEQAKEMSRCYYSNYYIVHNRIPIKYQQFENKYLKYFIEVSRKFSIRENFNPRDFIRSAMRGEFKYPAQLNFEYLWKNYLEELALIKQEKEEEEKRKDSIWDNEETRTAKRVVRFF